MWTSHQIIHWAVQEVAGTLGILLDSVRVISAYVRDGFGLELMVYGDPILAAMAASHPVKVALTRSQIYNHSSHRPAAIQRFAEPPIKPLHLRHIRLDISEGVDWLQPALDDRSGRAASEG